MNRPKYKKMYLECRSELKMYENIIDNMLRNIEELGLEIPINDMVPAGDGFYKIRRIVITNGEKTRWLSFKVGDSNA